MENEMKNATMTDSMSMDTMRSSSFFGEVNNRNKDEETALMGLIKNQMLVLEEDLYGAKIEFAEAALDRDNWSVAKEKEIACKVIEGQMHILSKMQRDFENMLTPAA